MVTPRRHIVGSKVHSSVFDPRPASILGSHGAAPGMLWEGAAGCLTSKVQATSSPTGGPPSKTSHYPVKMGWWPCFGTLKPNSWWRTNHLDDFNMFTAAVPWFQPPSPKKQVIPADARRILENGERDAVGAASLQHIFGTCDRKISSGDRDTMGKIPVQTSTKGLLASTLDKLTIEDP